MKLSIIIPTYNRQEILAECLRSLCENSGSSQDTEIIIIDDGSTDNTLTFLQDFKSTASIDTQIFRQEHRGPAAARNLGIKKSRGDVLLFTGDDIIAGPALLPEHIAWHKMYPDDNIAVLGYVTWSSKIKITPFMQWLENGGPQFKFWSISNPFDVSWRHLYTSNISFKRRFLLDKGLFDEDFPYASCEDIELGYRLSQRGLRIIFNRSATGYHFHPTSLDDAVERMARVSASYRIFQLKTGLEIPCDIEHKHGHLWSSLSNTKFMMAKKIGHMAEPRLVIHRLYSYLMDKAKYI